MPLADDTRRSARGEHLCRRPMSKAGERVIDLDKGTVSTGRTHPARRKRERLATGDTWQESGRMLAT